MNESAWRFVTLPESLSIEMRHLNLTSQSIQLFWTVVLLLTSVTQATSALPKSTSIEKSTTWLARFIASMQSDCVFSSHVVNADLKHCLAGEEWTKLRSSLGTFLSETPNSKTNLKLCWCQQLQHTAEPVVSAAPAAAALTLCLITLIAFTHNAY